MSTIYKLPRTKARAGAKLPHFKAGRSRPSLSSASDMNGLVDGVNGFLNMSVIFGDVPEPLFNITENGAVLVLPRSSAADDPSGASVSKAAFTLVSVQADYLTCNKVSDGSLVYVAKTPKLRNYAGPEMIGDRSWTYDYDSTTQRTATSNGGITVTQVVTPTFAVGDIIFASQPDDTLVAGTEWMMENDDARAWTFLPIIIGVKHEGDCDLYSKLFMATNTFPNP